MSRTAPRKAWRRIPVSVSATDFERFVLPALSPTRGPAWSHSITGTSPTERPHYGSATASRSRNNYISSDHPEWGEDKIAEELAAKFGITHSGSTIRRYMVPRSEGPRDGQTWRTFIKNHAHQMWACDFLTQHTAYFSVVYILVIGSCSCLACPTVSPLLTR